MEKDELLGQILSIIRTIKEDKDKLQKVLDFLLLEIYEEPEEVLNIPDKYKKLVHEVADFIDAGLTCFINPRTLAMEQVPQDLNDPDEYRMITGSIWKDSFKHNKWKRCITVEPPESYISFNIMEQFTKRVNDKRLQNRLVDALNRKKPFANFKYIIESSEYLQEWFEFKKTKLEEYVWEQLETEFNENNESK